MPCRSRVPKGTPELNVCHYTRYIPHSTALDEERTRGSPVTAMTDGILGNFLSGYPSFFEVNSIVQIQSECFHE